MKHNPPFDYSLYLVTNRKLLKGKHLLKSIEESIAGGVTLVQLREKELCTRDFFDLAVQVKAVTDRYHVPLIVNDRLDIALAADAAGLHLGQDDLPVKVAREILGTEKLLGVSVSNEEEALKAQADGADYLGVGAIFPTGTKLDASPVTLETLRLIKARVVIPVVAIGGINQNNVRAVMNQRVDGIAVVSAILDKDDCRLAAKNLLDLVLSSKTGLRCSQNKPAPRTLISLPKQN
jgi:thiamine-phosphate pyrophosphorylase